MVKVYCGKCYAIGHGESFAEAEEAIQHHEIHSERPAAWEVKPKCARCNRTTESDCETCPECDESREIAKQEAAKRIARIASASSLDRMQMIEDDRANDAANE